MIIVNFKIKNTKEKEPSTNKSLYIKTTLVKKIDKIAREHNTSWNNVVISMIESCLSENQTEEN